MDDEFGDRVNILTVYTLEAHPAGCPSPYSGDEWTMSASKDEEGNPLGQPETYEERVSQATQMARELGITVPVLIDEMDNPVWCTYGPAPNAAYFIGTNGEVIVKQGWYEPKPMRTQISVYLEQ